MLQAKGLGYRVEGRWLLRGVDLEVEPGTFLAVVGPNGSGKTTLLRLLSGEVRPTEGEVRLEGKALAAYRPEELARLRGVLSQTRSVAFPYTAYEVALLGRLPHLKGGREGPEDHRATEAALSRARALELRDRLYTSLSGGEAARVDLARLLAQEGCLYLLDEPTNHLDPRYALELLLLFRALAYGAVGVVAVLHDLNLAALFADQVLLLEEGRARAYGPPEVVLDPALLEEVYGVRFVALGEEGRAPFLFPVPGEVSLAL
ncbi:ABC-type cobalamin/Fe3+-siderophore transport system, ATPase component (plasmid) [Thermus oshimai JL-2]|uniref:ABC-type cobalamin/Fe3+-siderophore transport system, ATPase component n=1 Tax=Thermus oshimai JL-2 TaxID=751945 RepID=K7QWV6_THEOS|nr:ATP-binding cassette domain-containing protein [Thermus oshimai]AFV77346.1 ABC-type cobalamin/Fe3+-siderophore transport system, ATPase component [Thermus oshimai JL-2]